MPHVMPIVWALVAQPNISGLLCRLVDIVVGERVWSNHSRYLSRRYAATASASTQIGEGMRTILTISQDERLLVTRAASPSQNQS